MRVSTISIFHNGIDNIKRVSGASVKTQNQISTGRKVLTAADDPVAATRILQLNQELAVREQFSRNITSVTNSLSLEESVLTGVSELYQRVREIAVQVGDGTLSQEDRGFLGQEVKVRLDELLGLMNSKDAGGEFIFAGYKGDIQPFSDSGGGGYRYNGDEGDRLVQIGATTFISARDSGKGLFEEVKSDNLTFVATDNIRNSAVPGAFIGVGQVTDQDKFDQFHPEDAYIEFNDVNDVEPPRLNYTVRRSSDNRVIEGLENELYISGAQIQFEGLAVRISGVPDKGDNFIIESSTKQSVLTTMSRLVDGLTNFDDTTEGREKVADLVFSSLNNLDNAQTNLLEVRSKLGARLNTLESTQGLHEQVDVVSKQVLSDLQDVDFAEAVSRLSLETFVLEAAQQSFSRIANLSLFKFL